MIEHSAFTIRDLGNNILHVHYTAEELALQDYLEMLDAAKTYFAKHGFLYALMTENKNFNFELETWEYIKSNAKNINYVSAHAIVIEKLHARILANFYSAMSQNKIPTKVFSNKAKALKWINNQIEASISLEKMY